MGKLGATLLILLLLCPSLVPDAPPITEPSFDGMISNPADVHMQAGPFNDPGGGTHASTDWELWKVSTNELVWNAAAVTGALDKVHIHLADGVFVGSYAGRTTMEFGTNYRLQVRFRNNLGQTSADSIRLFGTSTAGPPGVDAPVPWVPSDPGYRVELVASGFQLPVNIAFVPNPGTNPTDPYFYVTELYGTIKVIRRNGTVAVYKDQLLNYDPSGGFPGSGEQGLTGICVAPNGDVYATLMESVAGFTLPRVIRLTSADGGQTGSIAATLMMDGQQQGPSHQISHCSIGPVDGYLYVHSGDGFDPATSPNLDSWLGKVHRMNLDLTPVATNPFYDPSRIPPTARDYIFAYGMRNPFGGAWRAADNSQYEVENGPSKDRLARLVAGRNLGFDNTDAGMTTFAIYNWFPAHAPVNLAFVQPETFFGSGFPPGKMDRAYVTLSGATHAQGPGGSTKAIVEFQLATGDNPPLAGPNPFVHYTGTGYATTVGLAAGPDGLYFSDLYKDQPAGGDPPYAPGANVYRVRYFGVPPAGTGTGFEGQYFVNQDLTGASIVRTDPTIDFDWPAGTQPHPSIPDDHFSVRWRGLIEPHTTDPYTFTTSSDDGVRLWIDGVLVIDNWTDHALVDDSATVQMTAGQKYLVVMEYYESSVGGTAKLTWSGPSQPKTTIPPDRVYAPPAPPPPPPPTPPGRKSKRSCGATGLEVLVVFLVLRAVRRAS